MAKQVIAFDITVKGEQAAQQTDTLKKQLKDATNEAQKLSAQFGVNSKEALEAQKRVAELKDEVVKFGERINALHPDKFRAIGDVASGIAGGFAAAEGAMALFGAESEDVQKALLKVQAALAISQGLESIKGLADNMSNLKAVALDAFDGIKKAIMSNPLLTIATVITAATAALYLWLTAEEDYTAEINKQIKVNNEKFAVIEKGYDREIALARAAGKDTTELEQKKLQATVNRIEKELELEQKKYDYQKKQAIEVLRGLGASEKFIKDELRKNENNAENKQAQDLKKLRQDLSDAKLAIEVKEIEIETKRNEKRVERQKETVKEVKKVAEDIVLIQRKTVEQLEQPENQVRFYTPKAETADRTALDNFKTQATQAADEINKFLESQTGKQIGFATDTINQNLNTVSAFMDAAETRQLESAKGNEARQEQIRKKFFERDKKVQIAQALISTYQGATSAFASGSKLSPVAGFVAAAGAIAAGLANVARIRATQYQGGGDSGGGGSAAPSMGGVDGAPNRLPDTNTTNINPDGTVSRNIQRPSQNNINKVYVVSSEVEGANLQNQAIVKRSTL